MGADGATVLTRPPSQGALRNGTRPRNLDPVSPSPASSLAHSASSPTFNSGMPLSSNTTAEAPAGHAEASDASAPWSPTRAWALDRPQSSPEAGATVRSGVRWHRNVGGRWPSVHKADTLPAPPGRVRILICNWPSHITKESLMMVPAGSEPIQPPYKLVVFYDLRKRREELQRKTAFLVAYDADRLRKCGAGMGADALEASKSWTARDCICSDIVPLKHLYGEVQITLSPPDSSEGDVLVLLRIVTCRDLKDLQDWHPIGDAVVVRVEPRITREDKNYIRKLEKDLEAAKKYGEATYAALEESQSQHRTAVEIGSELRKALQASEQSVEELHADLDHVTKQLHDAEEQGAKKGHALLLTQGVARSKERQLKVSEDLRSKTETALQQQKLDTEEQTKAHTRTKDALAQIKEESDLHKDEEDKAKVALKLMRASDKTHMGKLGTAEKTNRDLQASVDKKSQELKELSDEHAALKAELGRAKHDADASEKATRAQETEMQSLKSQLAQAQSDAEDLKRRLAEEEAKSAQAEAAARAAAASGAHTAANFAHFASTAAASATKAGISPDAHSGSDVTEGAAVAGKTGKLEVSTAKSTSSLKAPTSPTSPKSPASPASAKTPKTAGATEKAPGASRPTSPTSSVKPAAVAPSGGPSSPVSPKSAAAPPSGTAGVPRVNPSEAIPTSLGSTPKSTPKSMPISPKSTPISPEGRS